MDELSNNSGIYKIINLLNDKIYIGCAVNIRNRWRVHRNDAKRNCHHSVTFQRAWNKYGEENFKIEILEYCDKDKLEEREQFYLDNLKSYDPSIGYNICKIGATTTGLKRSKQARENMRQAQLGSSRTQEHKDAIGAGNRNLNKWPHLNGSNCKCDECKEKRTTYAREKRWEIHDAKPLVIKELKWACPDKHLCKCDKCKEIRNEQQRERRLDRVYG